MSGEPHQHKEPFTPSADILRRLAISESGFIFDPVSGHSFSVNESGIQIVRLLQQGSKLEEIVDTLQQTYSGSRDIIERDLLEFISLLREQVDAGV